MTQPEGWRLWLSNVPLRATQLLAADSLLVAAWTSPREVYFFSAHTAVYESALLIPFPSAGDISGDGWHAYVDTLRTPGGVWLPHVEVGTRQVHTSHDGRFKVYQAGTEELYADIDGEVTLLARNGSAPLISCCIDRELGTVAALDADGCLHLYQQTAYIGAYPLEGFHPGAGGSVMLADGTGTALVWDSSEIRLVGTTGVTQGHARFEQPIAAVSISPDGEWIAVADRSMLHILDHTLTPVRRAVAWELLTRLDPQDAETQALPRDQTAAVSALDIAADGTLAFGLGGVLGVTYAGSLEAVPQTPRLL